MSEQNNGLAASPSDWPKALFAVALLFWGAGMHFFMHNPGGSGFYLQKSGGAEVAVNAQTRRLQSQVVTKSNSIKIKKAYLITQVFAPQGR
jgi:hypothetical protein